MTTQIEVFVDYVCPFCFLFEDALEELSRDRDVAITIRAFELRPDPVPTLRPEADYLPRIWRDAVYPMADRLGVPVTLPTISPQPRTEKAFMVLQLAQEQGVAAAYSHAMFQAFFQEDQNIGDEEVILRLAVSVGLDPADVLAALRSDARRARRHAEQNDAVGTVGVTSVPSLLIEGRLTSGVPSAARLKSLLDTLTEETSVPGGAP